MEVVDVLVVDGGIVETVDMIGMGDVIAQPARTTLPLVVVAIPAIVSPHWQ